jgi:hypothetical protein
MRIDFISVNDYRKNKNILWETYYGNDFEQFILKRVKDRYWIWKSYTAGERRYHYLILQDGKDKLLTITHKWWIPFSYWEEYSFNDVENDFWYEYTTDPEEIKNINDKPS